MLCTCSPCAFAVVTPTDRMTDRHDELPPTVIGPTARVNGFLCDFRHRVPAHNAHDSRASHPGTCTPTCAPAPGSVRPCAPASATASCLCQVGKFGGAPLVIAEICNADAPTPPHPRGHMHIHLYIYIIMRSHLTINLCLGYQRRVYGWFVLPHPLNGTESLVDIRFVLSGPFGGAVPVDWAALFHGCELGHTVLQYGCT